MSSFNALRKYQELICNFQKRNRELLYRGSPQSVCLTSMTIPKECTDPAKVRANFNPGQISNSIFVSSINSGQLNLDDHFVMSVENPVLRRRINSLRLADDNFQKEFGISGAWFVGPFLIWRMKDMVDEVDNVFISPIFKNPIDLRKNKAKQDVILMEEVGVYFINPTLRILLKKEYGIVLEKEYSGSLQDVLSIVENAFKESNIDFIPLSNDSEVFRIPAKTKTITNENDEKVRVKIPLEERFSEKELKTLASVSTSSFAIQDVFYIDVFDASKMSLYYDYEEIIQKFSKENSNLISSLVEEDTYLSEHDTRDESGEGCYVVDIDGSQHEAILKCQQNKGFVIQGPPGSGKSQTITNLISELLAQKKKVLFVAEKRAALDVVFSRLCSTGLGKHSVILHDNEVNKNALYKSYVEAFNEKHDLSVKVKWDEISEALSFQSENVSAYFKELHEKPDYLGVSNYEFLSSFAETKKYDVSPHIYKTISSVEWKSLSKMSELLKETQKAYEDFGRYEISRWRSYKNKGHITDIQILNFQRIHNEMRESLNDEVRTQEFLVTTFPEGYIEGIGQVSTLPPMISNFDIAAQMVNNFLGGANSGRVLLEMREKIHSLKSKISSFTQIKPGVQKDVVVTLEKYFQKPKSILKFFSLKYWKMRALAREVVSESNSFENVDLYRDWLAFEQFEQEMTSALDFVYRSIRLNAPDKSTELGELETQASLTDYILSLKKIVGGKRFEIEFNANSLKALLTDVSRATEVFGAYTNSISKSEDLKCEFDSEFTVQLSNDRLEYPAIISDIISTKQDLVAIHHLDENFSALERGLCLSDIRSLLKIVKVYNTCWYAVLNFHLLVSLKDKIFSNYVQIRLFNSSKIENEILKLSGLYDSHKSISKSAVDFRVGEARSNTTVPTKIMKLIENEANKTRRVKSPREVMESGALDVMLEWKRCWLMSPLSISQILPNQADLFDVVIFDEASQVKLEDAIPSIFRGKSLIVVGDNKQMPPTNFFGGGLEDDEDQDFELAESLLDQAAKKYPALMLEWHYRSEAESLIAFSNFAYYEGRLVVPPNPGTFCSTNAIRFTPIENGTFDSKNGNEAEAKRIVSDIREILVSNPKASVGVISMGMSQQRAISKLIEELSETDKDFEKALSFSLSYYEDGSYKGFFNRNLENVQGDERDYILLSVGYGKNKEGKFRKAFGPLSSDGGGRRLNVAITRARKQMTVYCSFDPLILPSDSAAFSANPNTATFGRFLQYAKCVAENNEDGAIQILNSFMATQRFDVRSDSFRSQIARALSNAGLSVRESVGNCGFVIDIGVFSKLNPDECILGIEINRGVVKVGENMRDSFKNRRALLSRRGWDVMTVWIQDWMHDKEQIISKICEIVSEHDKTAA